MKIHDAGKPGVSSDSLEVSSDSPEVPSASRFAEFSFAFSLAWVYFLPLAPYGLSEYDEGIRLVGGELLLDGALPYRDFYTLYGPAQFYWAAFLLKIFGHQILALRLGILFVNSWAVAMVWALCRSAGVGWQWALLAFLGFLIGRFNEGSFLYTCDPSLALILTAGLFLSRIRIRGAFAAGLLLGLAALFRHDFGVYGTVPFLLALVLDKERSLRVMAAFVAGIGVTGGLGYGLMWRTVGFAPLYQNLIALPSSVMPYRGYPYWANLVMVVNIVRPHRSLESCYHSLKMMPILGVVLMPWLALMLAVCSMVPRLVTRDRRPALRTYLIAASCLLSIYGFRRSDTHHLFPVSVLCLTLSAILTGSWFPADRHRRGLALALIGLGAWTLFAFVDNVIRYAHSQPVPLAKARGIVVPPGPSPVPEIEAVLDGIGAGHGRLPILVGCERHDKLHANWILLYFLSGCRPGTYYYQFDPGGTTSAPFQERIVADMERERVRYVVLSKDVFKFEEPNLSRFSSGVTILDNYISVKYKLIRSSRYFILLRRKPTNDGPVAD